ncbi:SMC family ATPase [Liquorilactobacillus mali]|uniref:Nuclease SbcCD subunit C n=1 Tax=Liquorilactobacillus mali TaxID=1618 RepID=A0A0R2FXH0_9LACO|nr:SMC family ATPase [Liquorilactobacillus mali]KRN30263.1 exonuclease [Liquorilactobacillus mali]MDN7146613.1 SMC family ATPase [Liquorilactobacillus mali]
MKPLKIKMTNFGPYAKQEIDFTRFTEQPLFLISGKTGSGKTTIFDAMCFALFGSTSGDDREAEAMRSGFAKESEVTEVEFIFEHQDKIYRIKRQPKQVIIKKRGSGTKVQNMTVLLSYQDNGKEVELNKVGLVNKFIQELIHLTLEQFTQIIMLPQGKFRNFLDSDSNEKEKLLRELFSTSLFKKWADDIQNQAKKTHDQTQEKQNEIDALKSQINEIDSKLDVASWLEVASERNKENKQVREAAKLKLTKMEEQVADAQDNLLKNKLLLQDFETLESTKKSLLEFRDEDWLKEEEERLSELKWFQKNEQLVLRLEEQRASYDKTRDKIEKAAEQKIAVEEKLKVNQEENRNLEAKEDEINSLTDDVRRLKDKKIYVEKAVQLENERITADSEFKMLKDEITKLEKKLARDEKSIEKQQKIIKLNKDIPEQELKLQEVKSNLTKADELIERMEKNKSKVGRLRATLTKQRVDLADTKEQLKIAKEKHEKLDAALAKNQIIMLSKKLKPGEPCPLCGSIEHPQALIADELLVEVTESDVEDSAKMQQKLMQNSGEIAGKIDTNEERIAELKVVSDQDLQKLNDIPNIKEVNFAEMQIKVSELKKDLNIGLRELEEQKQNIKDASISLEDMLHEKAKFEEKMESLKEQERSFKLDIAKKEAKLAAVQAEIPNGITSLQQLELLISEKQQVITDFETEKKKVVDQAVKIDTSLTMLTERLEGLKDTNGSLEESLRQNRKKLDEIMFEHDENLTIAKMRAGINEIKEIAVVETKIRNYQNKIVELKTKITDLKMRTNGKNVQNITELDAKLVQLKQAKEFAFAEYEKNSQKYSELFKVTQAVKKRWTEYQVKLKLDAQWNQLLEVIGGKGKVKLGLERYVLRRYLRQVLQVANVKLMNLTNERYYFELDKNNGTYATDTGLELDIFDADLGKLRSVKTLSGGESFIAALCLALAMAEVVQSINGGTQIDALFIDEGFGALDDDSLQVALEALQTLEGKNRLIGIISHVSALREQLPAQLRIESKNGRSVAHYIFDFEELPTLR